MSPHETVEYLSTKVGALLDPAVYAALRQVVLQRKALLYIDEM
jgi:hypothetical protein